MPRLLKKIPVFVGCDIGTSTLNLIAFEFDKKSELARLRLHESRRISDPSEAVPPFRHALQRIRAFLERLAMEAGSAPAKIVVSLPHRMAQPRLNNFSVLRKNPETKITAQELLAIVDEAKKQFLGGLAKERFGGTRPIFEICGAYADGYEIGGDLPSGGREVTVSLSAAFLPRLFSVSLSQLASGFPGAVLEVLPRASLISEYFRIHEGINAAGICIDVGAEDSAVMVFRAGAVLAMGHFPFGGAALTRAVQKETGGSFDHAEALKRQWSGGTLDQAVARRLELAAQKETDHWKRNWAHFLAEVGERAVIAPYCYLTGGGALLPRLLVALAEEGWSAPFIHGEVLEVKMLQPYEKEHIFFKGWPFATSEDAVLFGLVSRIIHQEESARV